MLKRLISVPFFILIFFLFGSSRSAAQCTNANVNWDNLEYFITNGNTNYTTFINTTALFDSMVQTQRFALGINRVIIGTNFPSTGILGDNTTHSGAGETGSYGTGADVNYTGNGIITLTFDSSVSNLKFSLYDIDRSAVTTVSAIDASGTAINVTLSPAAGLWTSGVFTPTPLTSTSTSVGLAPFVTANTTSVNNTTNTASLNIDVAGPVKKVTITIATNITDPGFWLSDIQACVDGSFPNNYYTISEPFTGQPAYVLVVHDLNTVYMLNPANGRAVSLFTDTDPRVREINNLSYDPYKRIIYYSVDGLERCTPAGTPDSIRHIKKYDVNTEAISMLISDVKTTPFNIPTFHSGLESGGASFYNGSLFIGVEGYKLTGTRNSGRESVIWRIDFSSDSITPIRACQQWGILVDNGTNNVHDWADFNIKDGVLYNSNSSVNAPGGRGLYYHINMQTGATTTTVSPAVSYNKPAQVAQSWNGTLYWVADTIGVYNGTVANTVTGKQRILSAPGSVSWVGPAGDAAEAFKPKADFGDAPSTYDPVALSPALHEKDTALYLGQVFTNDWDWEWNKQISTDATGDGNDDNDGLTYVSVFDKTTGQYLVQANVYNNTGSNATLIGWLDYNGDGDYDASEAITPITVASSPVVQNVYLYWSGISSPIANGNFTFLRIRLTSALNSMGTSNPTGYFSNGEVEDYRVPVDNFPLTVSMLSFDVKAVNSTTARLNWRTANEEELSGFGIERSADGINWASIGFVNAKGNNRAGTNDYMFNDLQALKGQSFYRLKLTDLNPGLLRYSEIRNIQIKDVLDLVSIMPNPAKNNTTLYLSSSTNTDAMVVIHDMQGRKLRTEKYRLITGGNSLTLNNLDQLPDGTYIVRIIAGQQIINRKLVIGKSIY